MDFLAPLLINLGFGIITNMISSALKKKYTSAGDAVGGLLDTIAEQLFATGDPVAMLVGTLISGMKVLTEPISMVEKATQKELQKQLEDLDFIGDMIEESLPNLSRAIVQLAEDWASGVFTKEQELEQQLREENIRLESTIKPKIDEGLLDAQFELMSAEDILRQEIDRQFSVRSEIDETLFELDTGVQDATLRFRDENEYIFKDLETKLFSSVMETEAEVPTSYEVESRVHNLELEKVFERLTTIDEATLEENLKKALDVSQNVYMYTLRKMVEKLKQTDIRREIVGE
ncbi:MAG: hypothetical protein ACXQS5_02375 [Candidatus Methanospirareceae archaeon]